MGTQKTMEKNKAEVGWYSKCYQWSNVNDSRPKAVTMLPRSSFCVAMILRAIMAGTQFLKVEPCHEGRQGAATQRTAIFRFFSGFGPESSLLVSLPLFSLAESEEDSLPDEALSLSVSLCDDDDPSEAKVSVYEESDDSVELSSDEDDVDDEEDDCRCLNYG
ncbi:hypothetical protein CLF_102998 [Clonorchis sinensis]|uniref:Uncharacterized protein n=1 Tax=Clonorchis sinensis TaxID=79923 RepID=G7YNB9_CLOSI|nr:hypothetical protein CLF_102998 [Clonorchis sinensis]